MILTVTCKRKGVIITKVKDFVDDKGIYHNRPVALYNCPTSVKKDIKNSLIEVMCKLTGL